MEMLFDPRKIRAVVSDMDDTLLNDEGKLTPYTIRVLKECIARGIHVIPASGRTQTSLAPYAEQIGVDCPYIACNGAQLISPDHQVLTEATMPPELAREICSWLTGQGIYVQVYRGAYFYYEKDCAPSAEYSHVSGMKGQAVGDLMAFIDYPVPKVLAITDPKVVQRVMPEIRKRYEGRAEFTMSKPFFIEAISCGVSKGNALRELARRMELTPENTLAFGDSLNDISMMQFSHNGVAVGNARSETKAAAKHICLSNNEDGVAHFLEENVLNPLKKEENV
ncbi:MAG: HAD family phosphatase [Clostridiales bacterium]|nr:HAD family phosphatase [Clostridiales bacterium]